MKVSVDVGLLPGYCALSDGYAVHSPSKGDKIWEAPLPGWQAVPELWFAYGVSFALAPLLRGYFGSPGM